ncbi:MAG: NUDIX domain-containing protein [Actinomycetota bacterium]|nr:NUDIX domain-containing protein [Actinomycetota bacterium]
MAKQSAGLLLYRYVAGGGIELLLAHPGGPLFAKADLGAWTVPKGEYEPGEEPLATAAREFAEELGRLPPGGARLDLGEVRQASGKRVRCFAVEGDFDTSEVLSNEFEMEWPPGSGATARFPEIDRAEWYSSSRARLKLNPSQSVFVDRLEAMLSEQGAQPNS